MCDNGITDNNKTEFNARVGIATDLIAWFLQSPSFVMPRRSIDWVHLTEVVVVPALAICRNVNVCSDDAITSKITSPIAVNARRKRVRDFVTDAA